MNNNVFQCNELFLSRKFIKSYRFVVLGDKNVGKTSFCSRYLIDFFPCKFNDFLQNGLKRMIRVEGDYYEIELIDT